MTEVIQRMLILAGTQETETNKPTEFPQSDAEPSRVTLHSSEGSVQPEQLLGRACKTQGRSSPARRSAVSGSLDNRLMLTSSQTNIKAKVLKTGTAE